jgi:hypothetical protein
MKTKRLSQVVKIILGEGGAMAEAHATMFTREWWITVFLVGLGIHLLASYLKPRLDQIGGWFSRSWANRNKARAKERQKRIDTLKQSPRTKADAITEEFRARLAGLERLTVALMSFMLLVVLATVFPHPRPVGLDLAITIAAAIAFFLSLNEFSKANNLNSERREAQKQKLEAQNKQVEAEMEETLTELGITDDESEPE